MLACAKRPRIEEEGEQPSTSYDGCPLLNSVPVEVLLQFLPLKLDAQSLLQLGQTCRAFRGVDRTSGLPLIHRLARDWLVAKYGERDAARWRHATWMQRLRLETLVVGFDRQRGEQHGYVFKAAKDGSQSPALNVALEGMGPKLLVSDVSTREQDVLVWRFHVRGNSALEFGAIPDDAKLMNNQKALHRCAESAEGHIPIGCCSNITVGSHMPIKVALLKNSYVEVIARQGCLQVLVQHPLGGKEMHWKDARTFAMPYKGPNVFHTEQTFGNYHLRLAMTSWAYSSCDFEAPSVSRAPAPSVAAELGSAASGSGSGAHPGSSSPPTDGNDGNDGAGRFLARAAASH